MVFGLTTAATLWIAASIGMACGAGMYGIALISTVLSVAVLTLIRIFERQFLPTSGKQVRRCKLVVYCSGDDVKQIYDYLSSKLENIRDFTSKKLIENPRKTKISVIFDSTHKKKINDIYNKLIAITDPDAVTIQELND